MRSLRRCRMKTLTIRLTSPLQSYGNEATFARRTTGDYPSKSAVVGMIAAALGYQRDDQRIMTLNELSFAVRIDQPGRVLTDYQTVEWKKDTRKVTYRDYLQDAVFVAAVGSDDEQLIDQINVALRHPKFQLFLGRRSNAPAGPLSLQIFPDTDPVSALKNLPWQASRWYQKRNKKRPTWDAEIVSDANLLPKKGSSMVKDQVVSFDQRHRQHGFRAINSGYVDLENPQFEDNMETNHDAMSAL